MKIRQLEEMSASANVSVEDMRKALEALNATGKRMFPELPEILQFHEFTFGTLVEFEDSAYEAFQELIAQGRI